MSGGEPQEGEFLKHVGCESCGGSDSLALYRKEDQGGNEYIDGYCWSNCGYISPKKLGYEVSYYTEDEDIEYMSEDTQNEIKEILSLESDAGWKERRIKREVCDFYGVRTEKDGQGDITARYYPITENGELVGFKKRTIPKTFSVVGRCKATSEMFGQDLFEKGGKFCIITGGEEDTLAMYQTLFDNSGGKYSTAVVSPVTGEGSLAKQIKSNFEWVSSFENVVLMLDNDAAGEAATKEALKVLKPSQAKVAKLHYKDPCEYLKKGKTHELIQAFWRSEKFSPAGIVGSSQTWEALVQRAQWSKIPLPVFASQLEEMLNGGIALGEITTIAAASSTGKTTVVNEFLYHFVFNSPYKVGIISLESDLGELTENLMSLHLNKKLATMDDKEKENYYGTSEAREAHKDLTTLEDGTDRYMILDHQGSVTDGDLQKKIEYLVKGCGCQVIVLDPLTLALSGERNEGMDMFMSWLLRFVKREQVSHINVVHVRKNSSGSQANSTGATIHEEDIKGSGSLFQVSMNNILLMRDKEHDDPRVRNTTKAVMSKARRTGSTGSAGYWVYDSETSRLSKGSDPEEGNFGEDEALFGEFDAYNNVNPNDT